MTPNEVAKFLKEHPDHMAKASGDGTEIHIGWSLRGYWTQMVAPNERAPVITPPALVKKLLKAAPSIEIIAPKVKPETMRRHIIHQCFCGHPICEATYDGDLIYLECEDCGHQFAPFSHEMGAPHKLPTNTVAAFRRLMAGAAKWAKSLPETMRDTLREACLLAQNSALPWWEYRSLCQCLEKHHEVKP